jgi:hypothetical protein
MDKYKAEALLTDMKAEALRDLVSRDARNASGVSIRTVKGNKVRLHVVRAIRRRGRRIWNTTTNYWYCNDERVSQDSLREIL